MDIDAPTQASTVASEPVSSVENLEPETEAPGSAGVESESGSRLSPIPGSRLLSSAAESDPTEKDKIDVLLKAVGDAPIMKKKRWAVEPHKKVAWVADFVRRYIKCEPSESLFLYVNQCFSPCLDQDIGSLYECFGSDGKLVLHYCKHQAWG